MLWQLPNVLVIALLLLSVISPKQIPKLKEIYNAGKRNAGGTDTFLENLKSPDHLVLISENFIEARAALSKSGMSNVNGSIVNNRQVVAVPNTPLVTVKAEPISFQHMPSAPQATPQEMASNIENFQEQKPNIALGGQVISSTALTGGTSMAHQLVGGTHMAMHTMNMISTGQSGVTSISRAGLTGAVQVAPQNPLNNATPNSSAQIVQSGRSIHQNMMISRHELSMNQGNLAWPQIVQSGRSIYQNMMISISGMGNSAQPKYVKIWEGNLSGQRHGQPVFITKLECFRSGSVSETLAANWPPTMHIVRLISQDHMNNKEYLGKADSLIFRAMIEHRFLGQLLEKKLCAVIELPSQTLLLGVSDKANHLIGMLFPGDMIVFKPY